jgi:integrase
LTWSDCDFENNVISVKRNLIYRVQENGKAEFHITTPKTSAGTRDIPMLTAVKAALLDEKEKQQELGFNETVVDGLSGFIFQTRDGNVTSQHNVTRALKRIVEKCNEEEKVLAERENREPQYVREFTAHNLRHTFCSRFCENEPNIKVIQEIMGHADISTTMDIYAEVTIAKKKAVFEELDNKIELF